MPMTTMPPLDPFPVANLPATTIGDFFSNGGTLMYAILACSVVAFGIALERYLHLRRGRVLPAAVREAVAQVCQGRADAVAAQIAEAQAPGARVLAAGLRRRGGALPDVEKAMEDQLLREGERLRGHIRAIHLVAALAPLLGLLGTVVGIAQAFQVVEQTGLGKPENLAAGIKVALYTTIFGLLVAIPAMVVAAHLTGRVRRLLLLLTDEVAPAVEHIAGRRAPEPAP